MKGEIVRFILLAAFAATPFLAATSAVAMESATSPLKITSCVVATAPRTGTQVTGQPTKTNGVTVTVTNTSSKEIKAATFTGLYNGARYTDTLVKTIAAGATLKLTKYHNPTLYSGPKVESCRVTHVDFADGTSWSASSSAM